MTDTEKLYALRHAQVRAEELALALENACVRIAVAGEIRRLRPAVSTIELVAIPKMEKKIVENPALLFDPGAALSQEVEHNFLWEALDGFIKSYATRTETCRKFLWPIEETGESIPVRVVTCDERNWGLIYLRSTGSEKFVAYVHAALRKHSLVAKNGRVWPAIGPDLQPISDPLSVPEEEDLFRHLRMKFVPAVDRSL